MVARAESRSGGSTVRSESRDGRAQGARLARRFGLHLIAVLLGIVLMLPFYWAVIGSLKQMTEVRQIPLIWWPKVLQWVNYSDVWHVQFFPNWVWNSVLLTVIATTGTVVSSSLAGFAFARFQFPGRNLLLHHHPGDADAAGLRPAHPELHAVLAAGVAQYLPAADGAVLVRERLLYLPVPAVLYDRAPELDEAARIDGASYPRIFWSIMLPLSGPVFATAAIIEGINQWNSFLRPLIILNNPDKYPLSVACATSWSIRRQPAEGPPVDGRLDHHDAARHHPLLHRSALVCAGRGHDRASKASRAPRRLLDDCSAALHHHAHRTQIVDPYRRIPVDRDQVRCSAGHQRAQGGVEAERSGRVGGRRLNRLHRRQSKLVDVQLELAGQAVEWRQRHAGVRAGRDRHPERNRAPHAVQHSVADG